jgi:hypothetical protein
VSTSTCWQASGRHDPSARSLPRRHELDELAAVAVTDNPRRSLLIRHDEADRAA